MFEEFLQLLGDKVRLRGFDKYKGGLGKRMLRKTIQFSFFRETCEQKLINLRFCFLSCHQQILFMT
jgi:hypothetical protein